MLDPRCQYCSSNNLVKSTVCHEVGEQNSWKAGTWNFWNPNEKGWNPNEKGWNPIEKGWNPSDKGWNPKEKGWNLMGMFKYSDKLQRQKCLTRDVNIVLRTTFYHTLRGTPV